MVIILSTCCDTDSTFLTTATPFKDLQRKYNLKWTMSDKEIVIRKGRYEYLIRLPPNKVLSTFVNETTVYTTITMFDEIDGRCTTIWTICPKVEKTQNFERFISSLTPIYSSFGGINRFKSIAIFLSFYAIGSIKQIICLFVTADDETLILLGDPFQPFGTNRFFLDILITGWIVFCFINFLADTYNRNARATIFWSKQMASLFEDFPLPSSNVDKIHHLGYDDYIDVCNKFRLVIRYARFTSLMSVLSACGYMTPTMVANPDYWLVNLNWTLFFIIAGTISILRLIIYPCIFLICVYTFNYKLTHIFVPLKINQLSKIDENTLIPVRETNTISDMKIMAKLYKEMFTYNQYWSVVNGFGHCMSFMINSYILYPIFFIPSTLITRLICVYWTILCLLWFAFPYLTVSYMNFKISRVNKRIFSKIKDLANPFEGIRLMVTMEHISEFKGFSIFTFHEPSYISFVYQSLDLITYFCLFIQNLGRTQSR